MNMNILSITPNTQIEVKGASRSAATANDPTAPGFAQSLADVARAAQLEVANKASSSGLDFWRCKEQKDEPFSFSKSEEEMMEEYVTRIKKLLNKLQK